MSLGHVTHAAEVANNGPRRYVVSIEVDAPNPVVARVRVVSTEVLERLGVTPIVTSETFKTPSPVEPGAPPLAYAYIDLENPKQPRLVVVDGRTQRELTRRTLPETSTLETSIEAVTLVLYMVLESQLSGAESNSFGPAPQATAEPPPTGATAPRARDGAGHTSVAEHSGNTSRSKQRSAEPTERWETNTGVLVEPERDASPRPSSPGRDSLSFEVGAFLRIMTLDNSNALAGGGAAVEVRAERLEPQLGALLLAAVHSSTEASFRDTRAQITPFSARLLPTVGFSIAPRISGVAGVGAGIDWFRTEVRDAPAGAEGGGSSSTVDATVSALLGARAHFTRNLSMNLAAGFDLDSSPHAFVVRVGGERHTLLELSRFRPSLMLGLAFSPTGTSDGAMAVP